MPTVPALAIPSRRASHRHGLPTLAPAFLGLVVLTIAGFWVPYFSRLPGTFDLLTHAHAASMLAWCALLIQQARLARRGDWPRHRAWGRTSYGLFPLTAVLALVLGQQRTAAALTPDGTLPAEHAAFVFIALGMTALFVLAWVLAIAWRRQPAVHARFMVGTALAMIDPALARLLHYALPEPPFRGELLAFGLVDLLLAWLIWRERGQARGRWVFPALLGAFVVFQIGVFTLAESAAWQRFAEAYAAIGLRAR